MMGEEFSVPGCKTSTLKSKVR